MPFYRTVEAYPVRNTCRKFHQEKIAVIVAYAKEICRTLQIAAQKTAKLSACQEMA